MRPRIAVTIGDVAGIGPEVAVRAAADPQIRECCHPILVGHIDVVRRAAALVGVSPDIRLLSEFDLSIDDHAALVCVQPGTTDDALAAVAPGKVDAIAGRAAYDALETAARAALDGHVDAIVTAPLHKRALRLAGCDEPGHTEILARLCGVDEVAMMLYLGAGVVPGAGELAIAHATLHTSVESVPRLLSTSRILETTRLVDSFLKRIGCAAPRIGVCALNPHGGEQGLFGDEEARIIRPAVEQACSAGVNATGPFPADTLIRRALHGEFDGVVAMYHDQGHIAVKLVAFESAVNVTLGLPIVRTSPTHGTAMDIAWQGQADARGMIEAVRAAVRLASAPSIKSNDLGTETH